MLHSGFAFSLLLLGGGGHRTGKNGGNWNELLRFKEKYDPDSTEKYFWAAQDCISLDNIPYIGRYSKNTPNLYTASGFNKWGMTGAMLSAMLLSDMVCGIRNDFEEVFSQSRNIIKPQLFINGFEATKNLITPTKNGVLTLDARLNGIPMNIRGTALVTAPDFRETEKCLIIPQTAI